MNCKKIAAVILIVVMSAAVGFSSGQSEGKAEKPYEISWYFIGNGPQADVQLVEEAVNEYLKGKINATVKLYCLDWGSYTNKMQVMIASGEAFDICFTFSWIP
ncbi:unnamed protein product [marine sediment metagenome]|uniref:Uncharacterized protein n=1 Tax=marine sediment metagenome TaxID=412755 RepID=X1HK04_9ZZZZ